MTPGPWASVEEERITPLGGTEPIDVNVRILCAASRDLARLVEENRFRGNLYYRLNVVETHLPPLRERREDIAALASHFVAKSNREFGKHCPGVSDRALAAMTHYDWPGNIREMKNIIGRAIILGEDGTRIDLSDLGFADSHEGRSTQDCRL